MNLDVYKKANGRWQATGIPQSLDLEALAACPFCGNRITLSAQNFHTAEYWIECRICNTRKRGRNYGADFETKDECRMAHIKAFAHACGGWNKRAVGGVS